MHHPRPLWLLIGLLLLAPGARASEPLRVFAAASLSNVLAETGAHWQALGHASPILATGASSTLARQIEAGAPADLYAAADRAWMDYLDQRGLLESGSRRALLGNRLVLIAPRGQGFVVALQPGVDLAARFQGRLCLGEPGAVPAGTYARQALIALGAWPALAGRLAYTEDVRGALAFVERGECAAGIVYATDAALSKRVEVLARFPPGSHAAIVYPFALRRGAGAAAQAYLDYLRDSAAAQAIFRRHGFLPLENGP